MERAKKLPQVTEGNPIWLSELPQNFLGASPNFGPKISRSVRRQGALQKYTGFQETVGIFEPNFGRFLASVDTPIVRIILCPL